MSYRIRRLITGLVALGALGVIVFVTPDYWQQTPPMQQSTTPAGAAADALAKIPIKGRAPKTGYARTQFGDGWATVNGCDTRNIILHRDLANAAVNDECKVLSGTLQDPYTGKKMYLHAALAQARIFKLIM